MSGIVYGTEAASDERQALRLDRNLSRGSEGANRKLTPLAGDT